MNFYNWEKFVERTQLIERWKKGLLIEGQTSGIKRKVKEGGDGGWKEEEKSRRREKESKKRVE